MVPQDLGQPKALNWLILPRTPVWQAQDLWNIVYSAMPDLLREVSCSGSCHQLRRTPQYDRTYQYQFSRPLQSYLLYWAMISSVDISWSDSGIFNPLVIYSSNEHSAFSKTPQFTQS